MSDNIRYEPDQRCPPAVAAIAGLQGVVLALALAEGGPELLASLTVVASLFYLVLALWLPFLRRVVTPVVTGTVLMLIAATILPVALAGGLDAQKAMVVGIAFSLGVGLDYQTIFADLLGGTSRADFSDGLE